MAYFELYEHAEVEQKWDRFYEEQEEELFKNAYYAAHGILMYTAFGLQVVTQITTARYLKIYWRFNILLHTANGLALTVIALASMSMAIAQ